MSFGGGGGGALPTHVHNAVPLQGGPLDFANDTISSMNAGSTTFSNGAALQELTIGNAGETLTVMVVELRQNGQQVVVLVKFVIVF